MKVFIFPVFILFFAASLTGCSSQETVESRGYNVSAYNEAIDAIYAEWSGWTTTVRSGLVGVSKGLVTEINYIKEGNDWPPELAEEAKRIYTIYLVLYKTLDLIDTNLGELSHIQNSRPGRISNRNDKLIEENDAYAEIITENRDQYYAILEAHTNKIKQTRFGESSGERDSRGIINSGLRPTSFSNINQILPPGEWEKLLVKPGPISLPN